MNCDWSQLERRGFVVLPGFLQAEDRAYLLEDFTRGQPPEAFPFGFKPLGRRALQRARLRLDPLLTEVGAATSLRVDSINFLTLSHYVTTGRAERSLHWHQDFDLDYRLTDNHLDYLNFWMPLQKPKPELSNLAIIPWDTFGEHHPEAAERAHGLGGARWVVEGGTTALYLGLDQAEPAARFEFNLEALAETPHLHEGDLLVLRGDTLHRTQDTASLRVAASVRASGLHKTILRSRLADFQDPETERIRQQLDECFQHLGADEVTLGQFLAYLSGPKPSHD